MRSPFVIGYEDACASQNWLFLVMEYANGGNVKALLKRQQDGYFSEIIAQKIMKQLVQGLSYLYGKNIIHRDLKLENLLVHFPNRGSAHPIAWEKIDLETEEFIIKIADFSFARSLDHEEQTDRPCGTPLLMAPEVIQRQKYGFKRDVWSLGCIFFQLLTGQYMFGDEQISIRDLTANVLQGKYSIAKELKVSLQGLEFLNRCLDYNEKTRLGWDEVADDEYLTTDAANFLSITKLEDISSIASSFPNAVHDKPPQPTAPVQNEQPVSKKQTDQTNSYDDETPSG